MKKISSIILILIVIALKFTFSRRSGFWKTKPEADQVAIVDSESGDSTLSQPVNFKNEGTSGRHDGKTPNGVTLKRLNASGPGVDLPKLPQPQLGPFEELKNSLTAAEAAKALLDPKIDGDDASFLIDYIHFRAKEDSNPFIIKQAIDSIVASKTEGKRDILINLIAYYWRLNGKNGDPRSLQAMRTWNAQIPDETRKGIEKGLRYL